MKLKLIAIKKSQSQQGFGLLETTAAAMLSLLFVSMGANLVLTANIYKIKAKRDDVMNSLIRADIESIKYQSTRIQNETSSPSSNKCSPTNLQNGFAGALKERIGNNSTLTAAQRTAIIATGTAAEKAALISTEKIKTTTIKVLGRNYILKREADSIVDSDILPIIYTFAAQAPPDKTQAEMPIEYDLTVQIIPNASLKCP